MKSFKILTKVTYCKEQWVVVEDNQNEWDARREAYRKTKETIDPEVFGPDIEIMEVEGGDHDEVITKCYELIDDHFKNKQEEK